MQKPRYDRKMEAAIIDSDRLLTVAEVGQRLRVSDQSVYRYIQSGVLPAIRLGGGPDRAGRYRISEPALREFLKKGGQH